ncbi:methyltransferase domain-containing protein [Rhodobacteraceae bacterium 2376]|uniref:Methyltransferase domain-containing protein n=1 Tax=Rhabdonatronobacter sediminivivens TaxID=2743469 RepID=A0A7Z0HWF9_9RHOB|nr:methyltransferase domain-containing protein [Rhabdonatronobacter sediminivivens]NYS23596.1 methyltransferase domain-containing protein [Rhabdonatronobacter sediminivivens]
MHLDVTDLRDFYYTTTLGRTAQKAVRDRIVALWPEPKGQTVAGYGFAAPMLRPFLDQARRVVALMPGPQGVMHWPPELDNHSVLVEETRWPLATDSVDLLLVMHGLESTHRPAAVLEECARVLSPRGQALFVLPNRSGLWARREGTPFALGRPYSLSQIEAQLRAHGFVPEDHQAALFFPPRDTPFWLRVAMPLERAGRRLSRYHAGGVLMVQARLERPAPTRPGLRDAVNRPLRVLDGVTQPGGVRPALRRDGAMRRVCAESSPPGAGRRLTDKA